MSVAANPLQAIANWSTGEAIESLPAKAINLVKHAVLDTMAVSLLGSRQHGPRIVAELQFAQQERTDASVYGMGRKSGLLSAALINGTSAHADLFDDNNAPMIAHPSAPLLSALLPLAQVRGCSGREIIEAYAIGFEVGVKLGRMLNPKLYERGWHATRVLGVIGATAACSRLLRVAPEKCAAAIGVAASMASGLRQNFGTMTMALHVGLTARDAVHAALLAEAGFGADAEALHGKYGFFPVFAEQNPEMLPLGRPLELEASGIIFKPFPSGAPTHAAVDAALVLRQRLAGDVSSIERVTCLVHPWNAMTLREEQPKDPLQAKVSLRYCVAAALLKGRLTPREFAPQCLNEKALGDLTARIDVQISRELPDNGEFPAEVQIRTRDGQTLVQRCEVPPGGSSRPMSYRQLVEKLRSCAVGILEPAAVDQVADAVARLEALGELEVRALCEILEGPLSRHLRGP
jgi:2-methylcitrate dehydratase PrpD